MAPLFAFSAPRRVSLRALTSNLSPEQKAVIIQAYAAAAAEALAYMGREAMLP